MTIYHFFYNANRSIAMLNAKLILISLFHINSLDLCQSNISLPAVVPESAVVRIHANASFECIVNSTGFPIWEFLDLSAGKEKIIVAKKGVIEERSARYRMSNSSGRSYALIVDRVDREHAGTYICKDRESRIKASAELTVIDSDPVCGTSAMENDTIWMWCEINSTGNLIPLMKWTENNDAIESNTTQSTTINGSTTTTASFVRLQLHPQDNNSAEGITVKCTTSFIWKNGSTESVPYYEHVWSQTLNMLSTTNASSILQGESNIAAICGSSSIVIVVLIILFVAFQRRKKNSREHNFNEDTRAEGPEEAVIYAEVKGTNKEEHQKSKTKASSIPAETKSPALIVGADGIEYLDFSGVKRDEAKRVPSKSSKFSQVEVYASVDHTIVAPSHPPKQY